MAELTVSKVTRKHAVVYVLVTGGICSYARRRACILDTYGSETYISMNVNPFCANKIKIIRNYLNSGKESK